VKLTRLLGMIPFEVERALSSKLNAFLGRRPSSAPFLSGDGYRAMADAVFDETRKDSLSLIREGCVVFVSSTMIAEFVDRVLPTANAPFVLVTHQGDQNIGESFAELAESPRILHWFAQNCLIEHPKVTPLPIGLEDRWRHNNGEYRSFKRLKANSPALPRIAYAFTLGTNLEKRIACYRALKSCRVATELEQPLNSSLYRSAVRRYMLVASPPGNGIDCHRTWEAIYMRSVPIVENNSMNRRFREMGAPMLLVDDWSELRGWDEERVQAEYQNALGRNNPNISTAGYWEAAFRELRR
jgi:hypothetical protein